MPCLSSRIPYGTPVTIEALRMIGRGEAFLRNNGLREVRVRHFDESGKLTARVEVAPEEIERAFALREELIRVLKEQGYNSVLLDLEGYRRGKMNDAIATQPLIQIKI